MEKRKTDLVVTGYVFNEEDRVLLIHHKKRNMWLPVGGHMEQNETPDEALLREIAEETGLTVEILGKKEIEEAGDVKENLATPFHVNVHSVGDHDHCSFFYVCRTTGNVMINKEELNNFEWFSRNQLEDERIPKDVRNIAIEAFSLIE